MRGPKITNRPSRLSMPLSIIASIVAAISMLVSLGTYWTVQRPRIGVTDVEYVFNNSPKPALHWTLIVRNVGASSGEAIIDTHAATIAIGANTRELPRLARIGDARVLILPGQSTTVTGTLFDDDAWPGAVEQVRSGQAALNDAVSMSYRGGGLVFKSTFHYSAVVRYNATSTPPRFLIISAEGD